MLFLIHHRMRPENRDTVHERLRQIGTRVPQGIKLHQVYHSVTQLEGWAIVEAGDASQLWNLFQDWTDMVVNHITPVLTNEEMKKLV